MNPRERTRLGAGLRKLTDYLNTACPQVDRITLDCSKGDALSPEIGAEERDGHLYFGGRQIVLRQRPKR